MNHRARRTRIAATALAALALLVPATAATVASAAPAIDEYTLDLPGAGGKDHNPGQGGGTGGGLAALPPAIAAQLDETDAALVAIATDPALGAPETLAGGPSTHLPSDGLATDDRGVVAVVMSAAGGDPLLPILLVVGIALIGAIAFTRSRPRAQT